jgi:hypothetical protein
MLCLSVFHECNTVSLSYVWLPLGFNAQDQRDAYIFLIIERNQ